MNKQTSYIFYGLITLLVIGLKVSNFEPLERMEWKLQDILYEFKQATPASGKVALIKIDDLSIAEIGPWPWSPEEISDLVAAVGSGEPRTVLLDFDIPDSDTKSSGKKSKSRGKRKSKKGAKKSNNIVADQMLWMKSVTATYDVMIAQAPSPELTNPKYLFRNALMTNSDVFTLPPDQALPVRETLLPPKEVADAAIRLGFRHTALDDDQVLRSEPLIMNYNGYYYPSASLAAASHFLGVNPDQIIINGGESVALPDRVIPTNTQGEMLLNYPIGGAGFKTYSATDILNERIDFSVFKHQLAVITLAIGSHTEYYKSPISPELPHYLKTAVALDNILEMSYLRRADSKLGWYVLILLVIGAVSAYGLPLISSLHRLVVIAMSLIALANVNYFLFNSFNLMASSLFISLQLVLYLVASPLMTIDFSFVSRAVKKALGKNQEEEILAVITKRIGRRVIRENNESLGTAAVVITGQGESADELNSTSFGGEGFGGQTKALTPDLEANELSPGNETRSFAADEEDLTKTFAASSNETTGISADKTSAFPEDEKDSKESADDNKAKFDKDSDSLNEALDPGSLSDYGTLSRANLDAPVDVDSLSETDYGEISGDEPVDSVSDEPQEAREEKAADFEDDEIQVGPSVPAPDADAGAGSGSQPVSSDSAESDEDELKSDDQPDSAQEPEEELSETPTGGLMEAVQPGQKLGRYELQGIVGKGAMGLVYRGVDPAINRPVALKTIRLDFLTDHEEMEEMKQRLFYEARAAGKLSHPNIVVIYDVGSEGSVQYIAMEFLEGQTLEDMIKRKVNFNFKIVAKIIYQICSALQYAHEQGIVHRDIKPANIMVMPDYSIKVLDFGIARIESSSMTKTGVAMGTPNYISPEQLKGHKVDGRSDIFSLGVVVYEMLIGSRPFAGENLTSLIYNIVNTEAEIPSKSNPRVPPLFDHICQRALKKDPAERYQKAGDMASALSDFVQSFATR